MSFTKDPISPDYFTRPYLSAGRALPNAAAGGNQSPSIPDNTPSQRAELPAVTGSTVGQHPDVQAVDAVRITGQPSNPFARGSMATTVVPGTPTRNVAEASDPAPDVRVTLMDLRAQAGSQTRAMHAPPSVGPRSPRLPEFISPSSVNDEPRGNGS